MIAMETLINSSLKKKVPLSLRERDRVRGINSAPLQRIAERE
jgi:hypothetical protein